GSLERRIGQLRERGTDTAALNAELSELDRRRSSARVYVALFGEISSGKSSLIRALAPQALATSDVRGGTTQSVTHHDGQLPDGRVLVLADVPGSREAGGETHETLARHEALRAHAVVYLCAGDLTRTQMDELRWLGDFGKPLLLALNKADQWNEAERAQLLDRLRRHDPRDRRHRGGDQRRRQRAFPAPARRRQHRAGRTPAHARHRAVAARPGPTHRPRRRRAGATARTRRAGRRARTHRRPRGANPRRRIRTHRAQVRAARHRRRTGGGGARQRPGDPGRTGHRAHPRTGRVVRRARQRRPDRGLHPASPAHPAHRQFHRAGRGRQCTEGLPRTRYIGRRRAARIRLRLDLRFDGTARCPPRWPSARRWISRMPGNG
ncbi:hypothetical protein UU5_01477, partial [Rhodanobacter sp. 115]